MALAVATGGEAEGEGEGAGDAAGTTAVAVGATAADGALNELTAAPTEELPSRSSATMGSKPPCSNGTSYLGS